MDAIPNGYDVAGWIACAVLAGVLLQKSWPTVRRWFGIGDVIGGLPELAEQVGMMATTLESIVGTVGEAVQKMDRMAQKVGSIEDQVANSHTKILRDDLDDKHDEVVAQLSAFTESVAAANAIAAAALEKSNNAENATVRLWERIDFHHPPGDKK